MKSTVNDLDRRHLLYQRLWSVITTYFGSFGNIKHSLPHPNNFIIDPRIVANNLDNVPFS